MFFAVLIFFFPCCVSVHGGEGERVPPYPLLLRREFIVPHVFCCLCEVLLTGTELLYVLRIISQRDLPACVLCDGECTLLQLTETSGARTL